MICEHLFKSYKKRSLNRISANIIFCSNFANVFVAMDNTRKTFSSNFSHIYSHMRLILKSQPANSFYLFALQIVRWVPLLASCLPFISFLRQAIEIYIVISVIRLFFSPEYIWGFSPVRFRSHLLNLLRLYCRLKLGSLQVDNLCIPSIDNAPTTYFVNE